MHARDGKRREETADRSGTLFSGMDESKSGETDSMSHTRTDGHAHRAQVTRRQTGRQTGQSAQAHKPQCHLMKKLD